MDTLITLLCLFYKFHHQDTRQMKAIREIIPPQGLASFACFEFEKVEFDHDYHFHPEIEITLILDSNGQRLIGDALNPFEVGDLALIGGGLPHRYSNWAAGHSHSRVIQFMPNAFGKQFFELPEFRLVRQMFDKANRGLTFSEDTRLAAITIINRMYTSYPRPTAMAQLIELLDVLSQDSEARAIAGIGYAEKLNHQTVERLQRVLAFIDANWDEKLSLDDVAKVAALHPQSLSRFFRKHLSTSFQSYLIHLRLNRAARRLLETTQTVTEIAFSSGFDNMANFNRHFRRHYGYSPKEFRLNRIAATNPLHRSQPSAPIAYDTPRVTHKSRHPCPAPCIERPQHQRAPHPDNSHPTQTLTPGSAAQRRKKLKSLR